MTERERFESWARPVMDTSRGLRSAHQDPSKYNNYEVQAAWDAWQERAAQPAPNAVAYLDLGVGGYMDIGTDLTDEELATLPKGRHMLGIIGTYGVDGYVPAQPAQSVLDGWLRAIDEALVVAHVGVANEIDTYEQAKAKLDSLLGFHVDAATDPAVNGGWKLVPRPPTPTMVKAGLESSHVLNVHRVLACYDAMIDAAPEAKP